MIVVSSDICQEFEGLVSSFLKTKYNIRFQTLPNAIRRLHRCFIAQKPIKYNLENALAYASYYGLINNLKFFGLLQSFQELQLNEPILDFGSGPLGVLMVAQRFGLTRLSYFEPSPHNRRLLQDFATFLNLAVESYSPIAKFNTILALNVFREASNPKHLLKWLSKNLTDQGKLIIIEPGDKDSNTRLISLKNHLKDLEISFPCPHNKACPLLGTKDWCHNVIELQRGKYLRELDRKINLNHHRVKLSCLVFSKHKNSRDKVVVSFKGNFTAICAKEGLIKSPSIKKERLWDQRA